MRFFRGFLVAALALCAASPAIAQQNPQYNPTNNSPTSGPVLNYPRAGYFPNEGFDGALDMSAATNVASTTAVNLPGLSFTLPAVTIGDYTRRVLILCYSADVTKATGGSGAIQIAQDGVVWSTSPRYISSGAGRGTIGGCFEFSRITPLVPTTITVQAVSTDGNTFTVTNAQAYLTSRLFN